MIYKCISIKLVFVFLSKGGRMKKITVLLCMVLCFLTTSFAYNELRVRHILADISCGGPVSYYERHMDESHVAEAVRRWKKGVRVVNASSFDRVIVNGKWTIVYKGTTRAINSADVRLNTD